MLYIKMYKWVLDADLSPNEKILLSLLRSIYESLGKDNLFQYSKVKMARFLNWSNKSMDKYLKSLKDKKYIKFSGKNGSKTYFYLCDNETEQIIQELSIKWHK